MINKTNYLQQDSNEKLLGAENLYKMNSITLKVNGLLKEKIKKEIGKGYPLLLANDDYLTVRYEGKEKKVKYIEQGYHFLKSLAHIPMALTTFAVFASQVNEIDIETIETIQNAYNEARAERKEVLQKLEGATGLLKECHSALQKLASYLPEKFQDLESMNLEQLFQPLNPLIEKIIDQAAGIRIEGLKKSVKEIQENIPKNVWDRLSIVVMGAADAEKGELTMQYFGEVLTETEKVTNSNGCPFHAKKKTEQRLVFASTFKEEDAIGRLVNRIFDDMIGKTVLGDSEKMHSDVLAVATSRILSNSRKLESGT